VDSPIARLESVPEKCQKMLQAALSFNNDCKSLSIRLLRLLSQEPIEIQLQAPATKSQLI